MGGDRMGIYQKEKQEEAHNASERARARARACVCLAAAAAAGEMLEKRMKTPRRAEQRGDFRVNVTTP